MTATAIGPAVELRELQARLRRLNGKLRQGEAYHVELDAICSRMGEVAMVVEGMEPAGRVWRASGRSAPALDVRPGPHGLSVTLR